MSSNDSEQGEQPTDAVARPRSRTGGRSRVELLFLALRKGDPRVRLRVAVATGGVLAMVVAFAACGGCGRRPAANGEAASLKASGPGVSDPQAADAAALRDPLLWSNARDGELEDLATLAVHEGAAGLVEAAAEPELRTTAIRAMAFARGWAQLPFLAKVASGKDEEQAGLALASAIELAARPRTSEDPEDAEELREGCEALAALARDESRPRPRRVGAVRSLRMLPCPPLEIPSDVDAR